MRQHNVALLALLFLSCNGFVGEANVEVPAGAPISIVDPEYVVLRPVTATATPGAIAATVFGQTVYFIPSERVLDLRHLDPRTAKVEERPVGTYVVSIGTTPEGDHLLGSWTSANIEKQLGVFVGDSLVSAPLIKSKITGMVILDGGFTRPQAEAVVERLRRGGSEA
ncbi:MAG TPA: hypothetical protein VHL58_08065 [Thermoanaerobaculia bacterium]|nr:hypothetical protein [Thermoanaerobaculia bacterium]